MTGTPGRRVLIVEDDYYLATDAQQALETSGFSAVGPFPQPEDAIRFIENEDVDCALVDINLGQGPSFKVAQALQAKAIPFAFVTGYDSPTIPNEFAEVIRVEKPFTERGLVETVTTLTLG